MWLSLTCSVAQASASHLRPVFAQHVIALDAEVRDKYSQMAEEEKQRRLQVRCTGHCCIVASLTPWPCSSSRSSGCRRYSAAACRSARTVRRTRESARQTHADTQTTYNHTQSPLGRRALTLWCAGLFNENQELRRKSSVAPAEAPPAQPAPPPMVKAPAALFPAFDGPNKAWKPLLPADLGQLRFKVAEQIKIVVRPAQTFYA